MCECHHGYSSEGSVKDSWRVPSRVVAIVLLRKKISNEGDPFMAISVLILPVLEITCVALVLLSFLKKQSLKKYPFAFYYFVVYLVVCSQSYCWWLLTQLLSGQSNSAGRSFHMMLCTIYGLAVCLYSSCSYWFDLLGYLTLPSWFLFSHYLSIPTTKARAR